MTQYHDRRMLTAGYLRDNGDLLLDDETAQAYSEGDYPTLRLELPGFDVELELYKLGVTGARIGDLIPAKREEFRRLVRLKIGN